MQTTATDYARNGAGGADGGLAVALLGAQGVRATADNVAQLYQDAERALAEKSLRHYIRQAWHVIEPGRYVHGWHIEAICEHLEAVTAGEIRNLIINVPPRHMKSLAVSVFWPTWVWINQPASQWLVASYSQSLAVRDAVKARRIIQSMWYQDRWGDRFGLASDQNVKTRYENDRGGHRIAIGVGGQATGEGGDYLIADDLLKAQDADSRARAAANDFWDTTMSTRGNDPATVRKVVIMQRLHTDDLTGHILHGMKTGEGEHYEVLVLPARYEPQKYVSGIGWEEPREKPGELLWPERFDETTLAELEISIGDRRAVAGQLQQSPTAEGGNIFLQSWWDGKHRYDPADRSVFARNVGRWISIDTALKDRESSDYTAWGVYELSPEYQLLKRDAAWKRLQFPLLVDEVEALAVRWNYDDKLRGILIEDKGSGTSALQTVRQLAPDGVAELLIAFQPQGSKEYRARQASAWCDRGMVLLPEPSEAAPWLHDFCEIFLFDFPAVAHDDPVDEFVQMILYLEHYLAEGWRAQCGGF